MFSDYFFLSQFDALSQLEQSMVFAHSYIQQVRSSPVAITDALLMLLKSQRRSVGILGTSSYLTSSLRVDRECSNQIINSIYLFSVPLHDNNLASMKAIHMHILRLCSTGAVS